MKVKTGLLLGAAAALVGLAGGGVTFHNRHSY